jgi:hypothetical protein
MTTKPGGRSALILVSGLFVCLAGPSPAATGAENTATGLKSERASALPQHARHGSYHRKSYAHRKSTEMAAASPIANNAAAADDGDKSSVIPLWVADANARMASADTPAGGNAKAMSVRANDIVANLANVQVTADTQVVAADQLNEVDRALQENSPATAAMASADAPVAATAPVMASNSADSAWDETSLIGKIFIGFGALLTMASAARMFMA